jgi:hypothetical protein
MQGRAEPGIASGLLPARGRGALLKASAHGQHQQDIEQAVENGLLPRRRGAQLPGEQRDDVVQRIVGGGSQQQGRRQRPDQATANITGESVGAAQEYCCCSVFGVLVSGMLLTETLG